MNQSTPKHKIFLNDANTSITELKLIPNINTNLAHDICSRRYVEPLSDQQSFIESYHQITNSLIVKGNVELIFDTSKFQSQVYSVRPSMLEILWIRDMPHMDYNG